MSCTVASTRQILWVADKQAEIKVSDFLKIITRILVDIKSQHKQNYVTFYILNAQKLLSINEH